MPPIHILMKPASGLCNMRCKYCFYADEMQNREQASYGVMSPETLENVIQKTLDFAEGACTIAFQGGEPTLAGLDFYRECLRLEKKYNRKNIPISHALQTNGYLLDEEWCSFFAQNHFLIGLSVDGIRATHDAYRRDAKGEDTYFHTMEGAKLLKKAGAEFNVLTVVNAKTAPKIGRIYENYRKSGFFWQQYIACLDPVGEKQGQKEPCPQVGGDILHPPVRHFADHLLGLGADGKNVLLGKNNSHGGGGVEDGHFILLGHGDGKVHNDQHLVVVLRLDAGGLLLVQGGADKVLVQPQLPGEVLNLLLGGGCHIDPAARGQLLLADHTARLRLVDIQHDDSPFQERKATGKEGVSCQWVRSCSVFAYCLQGRYPKQ